jgi:lipoprotein-anchoring transpeptidase ErfK/SrfK
VSVTHLAKRWLFCAGAVAAVGGSACLQLGLASAGRVSRAALPAPDAAVGLLTAYVPPKVNLKLGDHGPAVRSVQKRLNQLGYYAGPANGTYGTDLEQAVWAFKEVQGLPMNAHAANDNSVITRSFRHALISPRPPFAKYRQGGAGRIEVNQSIQVLVLYRHNKPHLILHVSTGPGCLPGRGCGWITPDGRYTVLSYTKGYIYAPLGPMENAVFFIGSVFAIHGGEPLPWYPDSHGCIRIGDDVVRWFHAKVRIGATRIYIFGTARRAMGGGPAGR